MANDLFISDYLERIGYCGSTAPCFETLESLQRHHLYHVPFENLDLLGSFSPSVDRDFLFDKIVKRRRGGVCYELNTSFYYLLTALGFSARQISGRSMQDTSMMGHVFTLVHLEEGDFIADVGYGGDPIPVLNVDSREKVAAYHASNWVEPSENGIWKLYRQCPGQEPKLQYEFTLTQRLPEEYMEVFRFSAAPGNTVFSERPICCRFTPEGKISLLKGILTVQENNQVVETRSIAPGGEAKRCLREYFDLP